MLPSQNGTMIWMQVDVKYLCGLDVVEMAIDSRQKLNVNIYAAQRLDFMKPITVRCIIYCTVSEFGYLQTRCETTCSVASSR